ncbi:MAG: NifB/NifX family molybdenum-iron cluster-binding protein [Candidatus Aminicenantales bacterium]
MKIAVSASAPDLDGSVDPRFGRCSYFLIVDPETMEFEAVENPYINASGGAGIQAAQLVAGKDVQAVLTGSCGPNAFQTLKAAGLKVIVGVTGSIKNAARSYMSGAEFKEASGPDVPPHFGMGGGAATDRGRGTGLPQTKQAAQSPEQPHSSVQGQGSDRLSTEEELRSLRKQSQDLRRHLDRLAEKMAALEGKKT